MASSNAQTARLEDRLTPKELDLVWDNWLSVPEGVALSPYPSPGPNSFFSGSRENEFPPPTPRTIKSTLNKKWDLFGSKKAASPNNLTIPDIPKSPMTAHSSDAKESRRYLTKKQSFTKLLKKKKSGSLKSRAKSIPNPKEPPRTGKDVPDVNAVQTGLKRDPRLFPVSPIVTDVAHHGPSLDSAMYFTIDPCWDDSTSDAVDIYVLSGDVGHDGPALARGERRNTPHNATSGGPCLRHEAPMPGEVRVENEASFLLFD